jgi:hypothetical protein
MRKPVAMLIMIVFLAAYVIALASFSGTINSWPRWVQLPFYLVAGIAWAFPLKPVMDWMNRAPAKDQDS